MSEQTFTLDEVCEIIASVGDKVDFYAGLMRDADAVGDKEGLHRWGQSRAISVVCHLVALCKLDEICRRKATDNEQTGRDG